MLTTALEPTRYLRRTPPTGMLVVERRPDGRLWVHRGDRQIPVIVRRCFPWSEPGRYISLRDADNHEVALVREAGDLEPRSRAVFEEALAEAGFVIEVQRVLAIDEEVEIRHWTVETRQGPRTFQTRLDDWPRVLPDGCLLMRDVVGDLYRLPVLDQSDAQTRDLLWPFVD